jgi:hypothetical protein
MPEVSFKDLGENYSPHTENVLVKIFQVLPPKDSVLNEIIINNSG